MHPLQQALVDSMKLGLCGAFQEMGMWPAKGRVVP
jgi:hypothetical protein